MSADAEDAFLHACARASGGNPFMLGEVVETLKASRVDPVAAEAGRVAELAPAKVSRGVLERLARLGPEAARLARAVAVFGPSAEPRRVALLAGLDMALVADQVESLARAAILRDDHPLQFTHPLVRNAVYSDGTQPGAPPSTEVPHGSSLRSRRPPS